AATSPPRTPALLCWSCIRRCPVALGCAECDLPKPHYGVGQHSTAHHRIVLLASHPALSRRPRHCRVRPTRLPAVSISVYPTRTTRAASFAGVFQVIMAICSRRGWASMVESAAVWMIGIGFVGVFVGAGQTAAWMSGRYNRMKERLEETELQRDQESQSLLQV